MNLKDILDHFYEDYDFEKRKPHDPVKFPHRYKDPADIEVVAFISSCLAYGKVELFMPVIEQVLKKMGKSPYEFIINLDLKKRSLFNGIKYRFNSDDDISCLLYIVSTILRTYGSLESLFMSHYRNDDSDIFSGLNGFVETMCWIDTSPVYGMNMKPKGLVQFFPLPRRGSACKRMNLFLRWMVRDRDIDFGIWKGIPKNKLIIPLDTHIARISRCLGFTNRKSEDWKMAVEITESLKRFDPEDPLKYDFALCHHGISGACNKGNCGECKFSPY
ncbi:MAG: TIGR02757 family protein [Thermodesulfovibrionales bacterium]